MTRHSQNAGFDSHMAYHVYAAMISMQYFHRSQAHPFYLLKLWYVLFLDIRTMNIITSFLGKILHLIFKSVSFGLYTGLLGTM